MLLSKIQGTEALIHYIERSTTQLVEYKALNLMDVGSSPMVRVTSYDIIFNEVYIKSQLNIILLNRPLGATLIEVFISNYKSQVAASMTTRHLGATYMEYSVYMIEMNKPDFFKVETLIGASLKLSLCSPLKTWGLQVLCI